MIMMIRRATQNCGAASINDYSRVLCGKGEYSSKELSLPRYGEKMEKKKEKRKECNDDET